MENLREVLRYLKKANLWKIRQFAQRPVPQVLRIDVDAGEGKAID